MEFQESLLEFYLPGLDHRELSDAQFARKVSDLRYILQQQAAKPTIR